MKTAVVLLLLFIPFLNLLVKPHDNILENDLLFLFIEDLMAHVLVDIGFNGLIAGR